MRIPSALALLLLVPLSAAAPAPQVQLRWEPVPLDAAQPARRRLGELTYLGGWALRSRDPRFGGISAMQPDGDHMLAVSDEGALIRFRPGAGPASIRALPAGPGRDAGKRNRDSESLVIAGGRAWIAFERVNEIWSYALPAFRRIGSAAPAAMRGWPDNEGAEAMLRLPDGRFIVFSEGSIESRGVTGALLFEGDPAVASTRSFGIGCRTERGYQISDAALLPDGRILLLERRYTALEGVSVKLKLATLPALRPGAVIEGRVIADFRAPVTVDNFEALAVTQERGRTIVWIASDDNFSALQRSLLLKFALDR